MKCFLTGGTGVVGRQFLPRLLAAGWHVTLLTRDPSKVRVPANAAIEFVRGDLDSPETIALLEKHPGRYDVVFHLAASLDYFGRREALFATNTNGTERMARFARRTGARRFVHASSIEAAGSHSATEIPSSPESLGRPISSYGESKLAAENAALALNGEGVSSCSMRIGNVYAPGNLNLIVEFGQALVQRTRLHEWRAAYGERYISPVHNADVSSGLLAAAAGKAIGVFNLVGQPATVDEIFRICADVTHTPWRQPPFNPFDRAYLAWQLRRVRSGRGEFNTISYLLAPRPPQIHRACTMAGTTAAFGWKPAHTLRSGVQATLHWAREQGFLSFS